MTGAEAAERILYRNGLTNVRIEHISGNLTDHYDPSSKVLRLSDATYNATSVAAVGVAAHECGHAVQDARGYAPLKFRSALVPAANFGSKFGLPIFVLGLFLGSNELLMQIGIWVFLAAVLFQIVTLPVEFDASHRAMGFLTEYGILSENEADGSRSASGGCNDLCCGSSGGAVEPAAAGDAVQAGRPQGLTVQPETAGTAP